MSINNSFGSGPVLKYRNEEQKKQSKTDLATGQAIEYFALTEPQPGSQAPNLRTSSELRDCQCVINGDNNSLGLNSVPGVPSLSSACKPASVPLGASSANIHDGVDQATVPFLARFPYLNTPNSGSASY